MDDHHTIATADEFLALYQRDAVDGVEAWRSRAVTEEACRVLLTRGFPAETLLLNKTLPIGVLRTLAAAPDPRIRSMVADKRSAVDLLQQLSRDPDISVRLRVVWNAKAPRVLLEALSVDATPEVRAAAQLRLSKAKPQP